MSVARLSAPNGRSLLLTLALAGQVAATASQPVPVSYSTYLGGSGSDIVTAVTTDETGSLFVAGYTNSADLPQSSATLSNLAPGACGGETNAYSCFDAFIAKLDPTGRKVIFLAYLDGSGDDFATSIAVDGNANVYISGYTNSVDLPTISAVQPAHADDACGPDAGPCFDAFVAKLNSDGSAWAYLTYLGGSGDDLAQTIGVDDTGAAVITGTTTSRDFPTRRALQSDWRGGETETFVARIDSSGSQLEFATFLGGAGDDFATSLALGAGGDIYFAGYTNSDDLPATDSLQPSNAGGICGALESTFPCFDAFVVRLSWDGQSLKSLTYLGGTGGDYLNGLQVDESGAAIVTGMTTSQDFPVTLGAFRTNGGGNQTDAFVSKLDPLGTSLIYSTYLGGTGADSAQAVAVDTRGRALVVGTTYGGGFPVTNPSSAAGGFYDVFLTVLNADGTGLDFSTRLGGTGNDKAHGMALDSFGNVHVAAESFSTNFPTANALQSTYGGGAFDGAVAKFALGELPVLYASPTKIDFGQQHVETRSEPHQAVFANIGAGELHIERFETSGDFVATGDCPSLAPGENCGIDLVFAPSSKGPMTGLLTIFHDGLGETAKLELTGEGIAPEIRLSATTIHFDPQLVGTQSDPKDITLTNSGTASLQLSAIGISGNFIQTNDCPSTIPVDGQCTIRVAFSPASTGDQSGELAVANSLPAETRLTSLTGSGTDFEITLPPEGIVVTAGQSATVALTLAPLAGFRESVTLACAGAPKAASCSLAQQVVVLDGSSLSKVDLTVSTTARSLAPPPFRPPSRPPFPVGIFLLLIPAWLGMHLASQTHRRRLLPCLALALLLLVAGCGGGGSSASPPADRGTPAGTYTLTLSAASGGITKNSTMTLVVR